MDRYATVIKPARFTPYKPKSQENTTFADKSEALEKDKAHLRRLLVPLTKDDVHKPSAKKMTRHLLNTLADKSNPITHSNICGADHVVSAATGHQVSEMRDGRHRRGYLIKRSEKLESQKLENAHDLPKVKRDGVLSGVRIYINGYLSGTTDIEVKRIIAGAGGVTLLAPSGATHILTSQHLLGPKTHKRLTSKAHNSAHVVRPEWVFESVKAGRRMREWDFTAIKSESSMDLATMFSKKE